MEDFWTIMGITAGVLLMVLAFSKWPIQMRLEQYERQLGIPPRS